MLATKASHLGCAMAIACSWRNARMRPATDERRAARRRNLAVPARMLAAFLLFNGAVMADPANPSGASHTFDIPAQALQAALESFIAETAHSGLYDSALVAGLRSIEVKGRMAPEAALRRLVGGTGLQVRYASGDTFSLVAGARSEPLEPSPAPAAAPPQAAALKVQYYSAVQASLRQAFCADALTVPGSYRLALSLWARPSGTVDRVQLLSSTGSAQRDARIVALVHALRLPSLPSEAGVRQPLTMVVTPRSSGSELECVG
ncbi:secretin and TonB N-terminal domain-containing protein [Variovorax sp. LT1R16]|uniref:secretin and TonB N-terminal domain-containing protein n=1 Tax=Variovorax sp. LT1R16 TaxID=3443728 RepID=UPI003F468456